jgi:integrase
VLDEMEIRVLWKALDAIDRPYADAVKILLLTGQRRGEVSGMRWDQLDLEAGLWRMPADLSHKNDRGNDVPLSDLALDIIKRQPVRDGVPYVFGSKGGPIRGWSRVKDRIVEQLDEEKLDGSSWNFHDLRRTVATHLARLRVNQRTINQLLNHEGDPRRDPAPDAEPPSAQAVSRIYNRYSYLREKAEAVNVWDTEMRRIIAARDDRKTEAA